MTGVKPQWVVGSEPAPTVNWTLEQRGDDIFIRAKRSDQDGVHTIASFNPSDGLNLHHLTEVETTKLGIPRHNTYSTVRVSPNKAFAAAVAPEAERQHLRELIASLKTIIEAAEMPNWRFSWPHTAANDGDSRTIHDAAQECGVSPMMHPTRVEKFTRAVTKIYRDSWVIGPLTRRLAAAEKRLEEITGPAFEVKQ